MNYHVQEIFHIYYSEINLLREGVWKPAKFHDFNKEKECLDKFGEKLLNYLDKKIGLTQAEATVVDKNKNFMDGWRAHRLHTKLILREVFCDKKIKNYSKSVHEIRELFSKNMINKKEEV